MRFLIAMVFGWALILGISQTASSGTADLGAPAATELPAQAEDTSVPADPSDDASPDVETGYECKNQAYCQRASQCTTYCGGGGAVCQRGCCACAS